MPVIESLLDTDLYKLTMMQAVLHQHPAAQVAYRFRCRTPGVDLSPFIDEIRAEIDALCTLRFADDVGEILTAIPEVSSKPLPFRHYI